MSTPKTTFFHLAREIRDHVYELAYIADGDEEIKITSLKAWCAKARDQRAAVKREKDLMASMPYLAPLPAQPPLLPLSQLSPPLCPLFAMLVNKQFYQEAMETYFRCNTVHYGRFEYNYLIFRFGGLSDYCPLIKTYLTKLNAEWKNDTIGQIGRDRGPSVFKHISKWTGVRELRLEVDDEVFAAFTTRFACSDTYTDEDFAQLDNVRRMCSMPSLQNVKLTPKASALASTKEEEMHWQHNVTALENYINSVLKEARDNEQVEDISEESPPRGTKRGAEDELDGRKEKKNKTKLTIKLKAGKQMVADTERSDAEELRELKTQACTIGNQLAELHDKFESLQDRIRTMEERSGV
ncbi:hypothetical protein CLAFUW4_05137 [Fulvia fulva]|uniref:Uncharacterized protein n=1 Tax=Passalora fulva TaxID=5499 RepID=A0A9Q8PH67_PASFU|nr:uncharacterized protein CLAFUR5_11768 [Fulvia fulva]KAK4627299.1 hypothetical protein CLAFUR4_05123 [Fulvia fulva]KAK4628128.1 hypothetical protein CLAFUR0_05129 [Fulvia fulva]UJO22446.1 hypothetical protein CLAFUR5_11768 [Fulvia fulva]WPV13604.1 hypothetical protein CLAFUW4_05137 [Fulvia fulva]WPV29085.1 hypothetical protein CLAFUW7_05133 [Fulvia fulva]